jgi:hypothetical protein
MKIEALHIGMKVEHPHYGVGTVKALSEQTADILFDSGTRTVSPEKSQLISAEPLAVVSGLEMPLAQFIELTARAVVKELGLEKPESDPIIEELSARWVDGRMVLHPANPELQAKEVPLEVFFHKIVMMRNNLRVLEQKVNSHDKLTDAEKVDLQQYISRCYGSMTTFNLLFKNREDQFNSGG